MKLSFYTNIPSPYNNDLFIALASLVESLDVYYYSESEPGRNWIINKDEKYYKKHFFNDNKIARIIRKKFSGFYFSIDIFKSLNNDSDIIIVSGNYYSLNTIIIFIYSLLTRKKSYWFGEKPFPALGFKYIIKKIFMFPMLYTAQAIFSVGNEALIEYRRYGFKKKIININYAINNDNLMISDNSAERYARKNKEIQCSKIIISSGALVYRKGFDLLINAFSLLNPKLRNSCELWILGDGPELNNLRELCTDKQNIRFFGFINPDKLKYYYNSADFFVFPTRYDGWGVVTNEALACGLPVIISDAAVSSELIQSGINGYVFKSNSVDDLYEKLNLLLSHPENYKTMRTANIELSKKIDASHVARKIIDSL
jgi:glycosyltransferase involved in cell wall biosynthesis